MKGVRTWDGWPRPHLLPVPCPRVPRPRSLQSKGLLFLNISTVTVPI